MTRKECTALDGTEMIEHDWLDYVCQHCFVFDEDGALERIMELEAEQITVLIEDISPARDAKMSSTLRVILTPTYRIQIKHDGQVWDFRTLVGDSSNPPILSRWTQGKREIPALPDPMIDPDIISTRRKSHIGSWFRGEGK